MPVSAMRMKFWIDRLRILDGLRGLLDEEALALPACTLKNYAMPLAVVVEDVRLCISRGTLECGEVASRYTFSFWSIKNGVP